MGLVADAEQSIDDGVQLTPEEILLGLTAAFLTTHHGRRNRHGYQNTDVRL